MAAVEGIPFLRETVVFLTAAAVVTPVATRLGVSPILGYLVAGALIGPGMLGLAEAQDGVRALAELGVVFLLFTIGLELSFARLRAMRRYLLGLGPAQVVLTAIVITLIALAWGNPVAASILIGGSLALSSTAIAVQLLVERGEIATRPGRAAFGVLLFQDISVVPLLVAVGLLGAASGMADLGKTPLAVAQTVGIALAKGVAAIALILFVGRYALRRILPLVAKSSQREPFLGVVLLAVIVTAAAAHEAGLSMALGAFLAGILLSDSEFRHQIESDIDPFKGLLLGLFFVAVGMAIDLGALAEALIWLVPAALGLIAIKAAILVGLSLWFGLPLSAALRAGLLLAQGGEFAFVILDQAAAGGVMPAATAQFFVTLATLTMVLTPALDWAGRELALRIEGQEDPADAVSPDEAPEDLRGHVAILGFGRVGATVADLLREQGVAHIALDAEALRARAMFERGEPVYFGDATRIEVLQRLQLDHARAVVIAVDDQDKAIRILDTVRRSWPALPVFVRVRDAAEAEQAHAHGASEVVPETLESSLSLGGAVLEALGRSWDRDIEPMIDRRRENFQSRLKTKRAAEKTPPPVD